MSHRKRDRMVAKAFVAVVTLVVSPGGISADAPANGKFPPELVKFVPYKANPVFTEAGPGHWDERIRERGWILREDGVWKLWYTGYLDKPGARRHLGLATSSDGIAWTRHPRNPLYTEHWVEDMMVVKQGGKYWMFAEGQDDLAQLLMSDDGLAWTRVGQIDVRLKNGQPIPPGPYGTPTAWFEDGVWRLFYERSDRGVWVATSRDMKVWTNVQDEPVLAPGPDAYDHDLIALNQVIKHRGRYYAYYHAAAGDLSQPHPWCTAVATSSDLTHWEKFAGNPLQPVEQNKSSGIVVDDGQGFRLYTMHSHPGVFLHLRAP